MRDDVIDDSSGGYPVRVFAVRAQGMLRKMLEALSLPSPAVSPRSCGATHLRSGSSSRGLRCIRVYPARHAQARD